MKKIALFSAIALSALMVGCSSTQTRSDNDAMGETKACEMKKADGKACPTEGKMDAKACAKCKEKKDGKMCADCTAKMSMMKNKDCKMGDKKDMDCKMGDKKAMDCKMGDKKDMDCKMGDKKEG